MAKASRALTAGTIIVLLAGLGCRVPDYLRLNFLQTTGPGPGDRVVAGSLETVAGSTEAKLQQLGLQTVATPEGEAIRITCTTKHGAKFFLILTRVASPEGERTHLRLDYESGFDVESGLKILANLSFDS